MDDEQFNEIKRKLASGQKARARIELDIVDDVNDMIRLFREGDIAEVVGWESNVRQLLLLSPVTRMAIAVADNAFTLIDETNTIELELTFHERFGATQFVTAFQKVNGGSGYVRAIHKPSSTGDESDHHVVIFRGKLPDIIKSYAEMSASISSVSHGLAALDNFLKINPDETERIALDFIRKNIYAVESVRINAP